MNKQEFVEQVAFASNLTKAQAKAAVDGVITSIEAALRDGNPVVLMGFGTFEVVKRPARTGRNPQTGEPVQIAESKSIKFRAGSSLKKAVRP